MSLIERLKEALAKKEAAERRRAEEVERRKALIAELPEVVNWVMQDGFSLALDNSEYNHEGVLSYKAVAASSEDGAPRRFLLLDYDEHDPDQEGVVVPLNELSLSEEEVSDITLPEGVKVTHLSVADGSGAEFSLLLFTRARQS